MELLAVALLGFTSFRSGEIWRDTAGAPIAAHVCATSREIDASTPATPMQSIMEATSPARRARCRGEGERG